MSQNVTETAGAPRDRAALLVAQDEQSDEQIAAALSITRRTLARWKTQESFKAAVEAHRTAWREEIERQGIARKQARLDALAGDFAKLEQVIRERGEDALMHGVAGGTTGLLVAEPMLVKVYESGVEMGPDGYPSLSVVPRESRLVHTYKLDTGLIKARLDIAKQMAQELGEWSERREITGKGGEPLVPAPYDFSKLTPEEMEELERLSNKASPNNTAG